MPLPFIDCNIYCGEEGKFRIKPLVGTFQILSEYLLLM